MPFLWSCGNDHRLDRPHPEEVLQEQRIRLHRCSRQTKRTESRIRIVQHGCHEVSRTTTCSVCFRAFFRGFLSPALPPPVREFGSAVSLRIPSARSEVYQSCPEFLITPASNRGPQSTDGPRLGSTLNICACGKYRFKYGQRSIPDAQLYQFRIFIGEPRIFTWSRPS